MKSPAEILPQLAALYYYNSPEKEKGVQFESLEPTKQQPFMELAGTTLVNLDKLNLQLVPKSTKNQAEVEKLLHDKIEAAVREFFASIKVWKKGMIPQEELVARIWAVWRQL